MSLSVRLRCWRDNVCYRHAKPKRSISGPSGKSFWCCDACDQEWRKNANAGLVETCRLAAAETVERR